MLNQSELNDIQNIESKYYMKPIIESINKDILENNIKWQEVFDKLYNYLENNKNAVKELTKKRVKEGKITNSERDAQNRKRYARKKFQSLEKSSRDIFAHAIWFD